MGHGDRYIGSLFRVDEPVPDDFWHEARRAWTFDWISLILHLSKKFECPILHLSKKFYGANLHLSKKLSK